MRKIFVICLISLSAVPLNANTELQKQAEHAQNYLEWTINRISYAWGEMKHHFHEGNKCLKDSTGLNNGKIKKHVDKFRNK